MEPWQWAIALKPILLFVLMALVVAPLVWILYRLIPPGRLRVLLFKVRDGPESTERDRAVHWIAALGGIVAFVALLAFLMWKYPT